MYKINNPYKECHIMDLNLMGVSEFKGARISSSEILICLIPLIFLGLVFMISALPEFGFLAECKNITGGDICSIRLL